MPSEHHRREAAMSLIQDGMEMLSQLDPDFYYSGIKRLPDGTIVVTLEATKPIDRPPTTEK